MSWPQRVHPGVGSSSARLPPLTSGGCVWRRPRPPEPAPSCSPSPGLSPPGCGEEDTVCPERRRDEREGGRGGAGGEAEEDLNTMLKYQECFCMYVFFTQSNAAKAAHSLSYTCSETLCYLIIYQL